MIAALATTISGRATPRSRPSALHSVASCRQSRRDIANDFDPSNDRTFWGVSGRGELNVGDLTLTSVTGYRDSKWKTVTDLDITSAPLSIFSFLKSRISSARNCKWRGILALRSL